MDEIEKAREWRRSREVEQQRWKNANPDSGMSEEDRRCWELAAYARHVSEAPYGEEAVAQLQDGSELVGAIRQSDNDWWWRDKFFDESTIQGWRPLPPAPEEK